MMIFTSRQHQGEKKQVHLKPNGSTAKNFGIS